jgi:glycosyltransferase involved in cell wall biosynthesis
MTSWIFDIASFNPGMDIICLTSDNEGTPVSLIEAQASSVPIVTTDVGGIKDIVVDNITGYIVPRNDLAQFSEKLKELVENKDKRESFSKNGWEFVKDKFHYTRLVNDVEMLYKKLLDK